ADAVARPERGDDLPAAHHLGGALDDDERLAPDVAQGGALDDDERLAPDVALGDELLALLERQLDGRLRDLAQLLGRAAGEQRDRGEVVEVLLTCHVGAAYGPPGRSAG